MADESFKKDLERLDSLSATARARVEAALKEAIEREAVSGAIGGDVAAAGVAFSRGVFFSRATPVQVADIDVISRMPGFDKLAPDEFSSFAERLAQLKRQADPQSK
jgi:hypothetical protein